MEIILADGEKNYIHYQLTISQTALLLTVILTLGIYHSTFLNTETLQPSSDTKHTQSLVMHGPSGSHETNRQVMHLYKTTCPTLTANPICPL